MTLQGVLKPAVMAAGAGFTNWGARRVKMSAFITAEGVRGWLGLIWRKDITYLFYSCKVSYAQATDIYTCHSV